ncbi:MAG: hypothetical protein FWF46_04065 [Oscillospiraceae bacterium]|nr:hypothetical protein [Oscillospiraceae bacterium]
MKRILLIISLILITGIIIAICILRNKTVMTKIAINDVGNNLTVQVIPIPENIDASQIFQNYVGDASYAKDIANNEVIADESDFIIIGTIKSIDGSTNYDPVTKEYTMIQTVGQIKIDKVLKGDIKEKQIPFIRLGGIITVNEYEKSIPESLIERSGINKLSKEEKNSKYISQIMDGDIQLEKNNTYLMYLSYNKDFDMYDIGFAQYGTKEIDKSSLSSDSSILNSDTETLTSNEYKAIKVKDNTNGNYDTLDSIIPDKVKKNK